MKFDYIIVGGGSAGCVLANRLSVGNKQVALFEAGPDTPPDNVPDVIADSYPGLSYFDPRFHWEKLRVHTRSPRQNVPVQTSKLEQARVMGGGSSINGQFAVRGLPHDYEEWKELGLPGWGWDDMLPCLKKLERDQDFPDSELHGTDGPMPIRRVFPQDWAGFSRSVLKVTAQEHPYLPDFNGTTEDGSFAMPLANENDRRVSTALGYLSKDVRARKNLHIFANSFVEGLEIDGNRVTGIKVTRNGETKVYSAGEVILSSGALHTPAILLRAGIGPANDLRRLGIDVVVNVPGVGENLTDHPHLAIGAHFKKSARLNPGQRRHIFLGVRYSSEYEHCTPGDMFIMAVNRAGWHPLGLAMGALNVCVNKAYSTGTVKLTSTNATDEPLVDLNLASDHRDLARLVDGFKRIYNIMQDPEVRSHVNTWFLAGYSDEARAISVRSLKNWITTKTATTLFDYAPFFREELLKRKFGTTEKIEKMMKNDDLIADWVKGAVWSGWHVSGTCRMGPDGDPMAVLDAQCRVRGVQGLRVVDASVMPTVVSANTNISTIAIAERVSEMILNS